MNFKETQPIYMQISDWVCEQILLGKWQSDERASSVRELGALLEVNPNTVVRSYDFLENKEILVNKRGVGFFIAPNAADKIRQFRKGRFFEEELPVVFKTMKLLNIEINEIVKRF
ncbi:MAG: GntR family transcriptional regulator [Bacteroidales bacterium]|jgi:DNA-binding transcriptional regulator YhcF (GntR family)|nr:GntR family transcriptional regulator [Bacteroidales bacterium]